MKRSVSSWHAALALLLCCLPSAVSATNYYFLGGRELSPGLERDGTTYAVLFAGWTLDTFGWASAAESTGGAWTATIRREGDAEFGSTVTITGGAWTVQKPDGSTLWGRVLDGEVVWPEDRESAVLDPDIECGGGVAVVRADVSLGFPWGRPRRKAGEILGCLDDQEWLDSSATFLLPPRIWVTMSLPR